MFGSKICLCQKKFWVKKILCEKKIWVKKFLGQKISGPKKIWGKKILYQKNFGLIDLNPKFVLSKEKQVGLTQGGGYMTPPPENSRVKIVLDCC